MVGENGASLTYVNAKVKACEYVGFESSLIKFPTDISEDYLLAEIEKLNNNTNPPKLRGISVENLNYLEKIINYCKLNKVKVFLIRSPKHKYYARENEKELIRFKKKRFANLDFLDFDKFKMIVS